MAKKLRKATESDLALIGSAINYLMYARNALRGAGCAVLANEAQRLKRRADGALRHAVRAHYAGPQGPTKGG